MRSDPMDRRTALRALAGATLAAPAPALASDAPSIPVVVVAEAPTPVAERDPLPPTRRPTPPVRIVDTPPVGAPATPGPPAAIAPVAQAERILPMEAVEQTEVDIHPYVVKPGDSMWTITADYLAEETGKRPANSEISRVWRVVMDLNEDRIRSGDVDLIFPGEELLLPRLPVAG